MDACHHNPQLRSRNSEINAMSSRHSSITIENWPVDGFVSRLLLVPTRDGLGRLADAFDMANEFVNESHCQMRVIVLATNLDGRTEAIEIKMIRLEFVSFSYGGLLDLWTTSLKYSTTLIKPYLLIAFQEIITKLLAFWFLLSICRSLNGDVSIRAFLSAQKRLLPPIHHSGLRLQYSIGTCIFFLAPAITIAFRMILIALALFVSFPLPLIQLANAKHSQSNVFLHFISNFAHSPKPLKYSYNWAVWHVPYTSARKTRKPSRSIGIGSAVLTLRNVVERVEKMRESHKNCVAHSEFRAKRFSIFMGIFASLAASIPAQPWITVTGKQSIAARRRFRLSTIV